MVERVRGRHEKERGKVWLKGMERKARESKRVKVAKKGEGMGRRGESMAERKGK